MNPVPSLRFNPLLLFVCFPVAVALQLTSVAGVDSEKIPIELLRGTHVMTEGKLGRLKDLNFLIDTGAAITTIDEGIAKRLELDCRSLKATSLFTGAESVSETMIPNLEFGPVRVGAWQVLVLDLSRVELGKVIDVIVGLDILRQLSTLEIDYQNQVLSIGPQSELTQTASLGTTGTLLELKMEIAGETFRLMLDSGADGVMLFENQVRGRLPRLMMQRILVIHQASGTHYGRQIQLKDVRIGQETWNRLDATLLAVDNSSGLDFDGIISIRALDADRVAFDFNKGLLSWE